MTTFADYARHCPHCQAVNPWDAKICVQCKNVRKVGTRDDSILGRLRFRPEFSNPDWVWDPCPPWLREWFEKYDAEFRERRMSDG